jgi:glycerophosphoryl diester phosphodiesterase
MSVPLVIGHRGACGYRPEHTLASYQLAVEQGADYIEPDLVMTRDGALIARHENEIGGTTDVAQRPEFTSRRRTQRIDGVEVAGWFTEDFTLAEIRTLRARERLPELRAANRAYDGLYPVPTFVEILEFLAATNAARAPKGLKPIGVYPETKHPSHFARLGLALEGPLLAALAAKGGAAPVFIQSFETANLRVLRAATPHPLVLLLDAQGAPWDLQAAGDARDSRVLMEPKNLMQLAQFVDVIGVNKRCVIQPDAGGRLGAPSALVSDAHRAGLAVHCWTFRAENEFLPASLRRGADPAAHGDLVEEIRAFQVAGIDGFFTDQPDLGRRAVGP